jgi:hypothetical protein
VKDADKLDEVEAIRRRHEAANAPNGNITAIQWRLTYGGDAHTDRATLLRLLDAARAELAELREAAWPALLAMKLLQNNSEACVLHHHGMPEVPKTGWLADTRCDLDHLAAALAKDATT